MDQPQAEGTFLSKLNFIYLSISFPGLPLLFFVGITGLGARQKAGVSLGTRLVIYIAHERAKIHVHLVSHETSY